jgi:hypothetical protein
MLKLICCCTLFVVIITIVASLSMFSLSYWFVALQLFVASLILGRQTWTCWMASVEMARSPRMFPKSGVSHNWM